MSVVNYEHVLSIVEKCANDDKSAKEVLNYLIFAFGEGEK